MLQFSMNTIHVCVLHTVLHIPDDCMINVISFWNAWQRPVNAEQQPCAVVVNELVEAEIVTVCRLFNGNEHNP